MVVPAHASQLQANVFALHSSQSIPKLASDCVAMKVKTSMQAFLLDVAGKNSQRRRTRKKTNFLAIS